MRAIGYTTPGPLSRPDALVELDIETPTPGPRDLLVEVRAVSVNPVDTKVRSGWPTDGGPRVLGYDAAGVVRATGAEVEHFAVGDEVYYAGDITRPGSNAELQCVDERIAALKPKKLDFIDAAGLPLTSITAHEMLFDCFGLKEGDGEGQSLLVVGGAGGVGSILIQLAKRLTGLTVIATASRPETEAWVRRMGADHVVDHRQPLDQGVAALSLAPRFVAALTHTDQHFEAIAKLIAPRGHIALIDDPKVLDILPLKRKSVTVSWEFMFCRPMFGTDDLEVQRRLLERVSQLIDEGRLESTVQHRLGALSVQTLHEAHQLQESARAIGKTVLEGLGTTAL